MVPSVRATILITGKVQGVFFRSSAMEQAQRLGLSGFIKNLPDGSVEAVVEGTEPSVEQFVAWCKIRTTGREIEEVFARTAPSRDEFRTFTVDR